MLTTLFHVAITAINGIHIHFAFPTDKSPIEKPFKDLLLVLFHGLCQYSRLAAGNVDEIYKFGIFL